MNFIENLTEPSNEADPQEPGSQSEPLVNRASETQETPSQRDEADIILDEPLINSDAIIYDVVYKGSPQEPSIQP